MASGGFTSSSFLSTDPMPFVQTSLSSYFSSDTSANPFPTAMPPKRPRRQAQPKPDSMRLPDWRDDDFGSYEPRDDRHRDQTYTAKRAARDELAEDEEPRTERVNKNKKKASAPRLGTSNIDSPRAGPSNSSSSSFIERNGLRPPTTPNLPHPNRPLPAAAAVEQLHDDDEQGQQARGATLPRSVTNEKTVKAKATNELDRRGNQIKMELVSTVDAAGRSRWYLDMNSKTSSARVQLTRDTLPTEARWYLDEWSTMSLKERRKKYNNVFDNFCAEKRGEMRKKTKASEGQTKSKDAAKKKK
ncbi:hypothetical protein FB567DRAFT_606827 [Paraphoma chrysanthemicola]|uniref:Uncharacterized protein n=1 Tax=Paraphoma chrysanthemicola TaxID=798071 RepID=A0A8K0QYY8_9PLEO|nr:hypothetical protein FB567DRAFT_606827 [Paraphoma chrysanthemicola]